MALKKDKRSAAVEKELQLIEKKEQRLCSSAMKAKTAYWKKDIEKKIPEKVYDGLQSVFCKGFSLVFSKGRRLMELSYNKKRILEDHSIRSYAFEVKGQRKQLKEMSKGADRSNLLNMAMTTVGGIGLGALGIGLPDIVIFVCTMLKGVYETALNYGYDYEQRSEQLLILKMMEASLSSGDSWQRLSDEVDEMMLSEDPYISDMEFDAQIKRTASAFAMDMLVLKFIQGMPVVGVVGGAANPVYYNKVLRYVQLKYKKRYLLSMGK